ncbi:PilZ domain-containing protein [Neptuniibacter sp. QD48_55]|uniref:PilZ domain-containing protein n=1 Tax=Neptuniibacter sp. QD48_55 TaxID=3398212 RepID=UPI0039F489EA
MKIDIEIELSEDENRRQAFRAASSGQVKMTIGETTVELLDISSTGVAFKTDQTFSGYLEDVAILFKTHKKYRLKPRLKVSFCGKGRCGAEFEGLSDKAHMALSELVVSLQKELIRRERALREAAEDGA